jgi:cathepsin X
MKKVFGIFIVTLLIISIALPVVIALDSYERSFSSNKLIFDSGFKNRNYESSEMLDLKDIIHKTSSMDLPDYFSWRDYEGQDWTTPPKDLRIPQYCGCCFLMASIGALESVINIRADNPDLDMDLSEQYVLSCLSAGDCDYGSFGYKVFQQIINSNSATGNYCNGIIPESCFPYQGNDSIPCEDKCENWEDYLIPLLEFGHGSTHGTPEDIIAIKTLIMEKGPVTVGIMYDNNLWEFMSNNHDPNDYYPDLGIIGDNHEVCLVGWKDDPSIGNGGYWIIKDCFGSDPGYDGFWNLEYGGQNVDSTTATWVSLYPTFLNCEGSLSWSNAKPGNIVTGSFTVENIGAPFSELEWNITDWPDWGEWTITPMYGDGLAPEDGQITVEVSVVVPDEKKLNLSGNITVINTGLESDYEKIRVSLVTPKIKEINKPFLNFLENHPNLFQILRQLLKQ